MTCGQVCACAGRAHAGRQPSADIHRSFHFAGTTENPHLWGAPEPWRGPCSSAHALHGCQQRIEAYWDARRGRASRPLRAPLSKGAEGVGSNTRRVPPAGCANGCGAASPIGSHAVHAAGASTAGVTPRRRTAARRTLRQSRRASARQSSDPRSARRWGGTAPRDAQFRPRRGRGRRRCVRH